MTGYPKGFGYPLSFFVSFISTIFIVIKIICVLFHKLDISLLLNGHFYDIHTLATYYILEPT